MLHVVGHVVDLLLQDAGERRTLHGHERMHDDAPHPAVAPEGQVIQPHAVG